MAEDDTALRQRRHYDNGFAVFLDKRAVQAGRAQARDKGAFACATRQGQGCVALDELPAERATQKALLPREDMERLAAIPALRCGQGRQVRRQGRNRTMYGVRT